ncbi:sigma-70 family RNA polymerase sigma factor [Chamaesiphon sp.]|uniref:sigma-70 family RNA polymerase sigma factor n=1 Tax=Chamaesiphon sp. TaxID=2814140 RepID=UPI00359381E7
MLLLNQTDAAVYTALLAGETLALGILYERYGEAVYRFALRLLGNTQEAEDLTQEVFITLWRKKAYDPQRGSILAFLNTLTRSKAIDRHRQTQAQWRLQERWSLDDSQKHRSDLMDKLTLQEISCQVQAAMAELSTNQRTVLEMAYFDGLSQSEIAENLHIPMGTVKTHKRNALLKLRKTLTELL